MAREAFRTSNVLFVASSRSKKRSNCPTSASQISFAGSPSRSSSTAFRRSASLSTKAKVMVRVLTCGVVKDVRSILSSFSTTSEDRPA